MDSAELGSRSVGSVKATVNFYDDKVCSAPENRSNPCELLRRPSIKSLFFSFIFFFLFT